MVKNVSVEVKKVNSLKDLDNLDEDDFVSAIILPHEDRTVVCNTFDGRGSELHGINTDYCFYAQLIYSSGRPSPYITQCSLSKSVIGFRDGSLIFTRNITNSLYRGDKGYQTKRDHLEGGGFWE